MTSTATRLSFKPDRFQAQKNGNVFVDVIPVLDTIETISYDWGFCLDVGETRDIILYLRKDYTDPIDEINWDSSVVNGRLRSAALPRDLPPITSLRSVRATLGAPAPRTPFLK